MNALSSIGQSGQSIFATGGASFGDDPFLEILVSQMQHQTPLDPVDNGAFLQQMGSFSAMKEQRELNQNMLQLLEFQGLLAKLQGLSEGSALLGKELTYDTGSGTAEKGIAESVFVDQSGEVRIKVSGGQEISVQQVTGVAEKS
jgi:flagellar basal-body rod modification protein FlgD